MARKFLLIILLCAASFISFSQSTTTSSTTLSAHEQEREKRREHINELIKQSEEGALIYQKQNIFGVKLNTDGLGFIYEHGKYKTINKTSLWWIDIGERHSPKEDKQTLTDQFGFAYGDPFKYGKINNFYFVKLGIGQQLLIGGKGSQNGVAVSFLYGGGVGVGLLKPYYLNVTDSTQTVTTDIKYTGDNVNEFLGFTDYINGASGFQKGLNEMTIVPAVHAKTALRFDYGRYNQIVSAIEVGVNAEYYTKKMQIMFDGPDRNFFFSGYVALEFGSRK